MKYNLHLKPSQFYYKLRLNHFILFSVSFILFLFLLKNRVLDFSIKQILEPTIPTTITPKFPQNFPGLDKSAMCFAATEVEQSISSKEETRTVNIPLGSNISGLKKWSANTTWEGGTKPTSGDDVVIPSNSVVILDENIDVKSLTINGKLIVDISKNININTEYIMLMGAKAYFEWGTETELYNKKGVITLVGNDPNKKIPGTGVESKAIMVMDGGQIELHGANKTSWSTLSENAGVNSTKIKITETSHNWEVGDEIVIAPSRLKWTEGEKRTITAISGNELTLNSKLTYPHIGAVHTYTRASDGKKWVGDMRAEVGLLSKNIKIQGDANSASNQHGGHIMIHMNGTAHVENIELYRMGQKSILGRYPFHWHLVQEKGAGQYLKNSSIHLAYNRAITIHGTESTLVDNNFCYDHIGHGLFLEDGSERFNVIKNNVVLLTKRPTVGEEVIPSDNEMNEVQNRTPASYWITNPNNIFENNIAAGTQGTGFWFIMPQKPVGPSASITRFQNLQPYKEKLGKFDGNKAHSCVSGFDIFDQLKTNHGIIRNAGWVRTDKRVMNNCTWYANDLAVYGGIGGGRTYTEGLTFSNNIFLDNKYNVMHANYSLTKQSVFVANSGENVFTGDRHLNKGYDGSCTIKDCHLVGWDADNANYVHNTGGANKHVNYRVSGITTDHPGYPRMSFPDYDKVPKGDIGANSISHPRFWSYVHWDIDGTLGGKVNTSIITNHPLLRDGTEVRYENWNNLYRTDRRFAYVTLTYNNGEEVKSTLVRTKAGTPKAGMYYINGFYGPNTQFPAIVNDDFLYTLQYETIPKGNSFTVRYQDHYVSGDEVLFRIKDFGKLTDPQLEGQTKYNSLNDLKTSNKSGYAVVGDYFYFKMVAGSTPDISFKVKWTGSITLPKLDTDGDGISDAQESINGTDPIPNDPIPTNPVLTIPANSNNAPIASFEQPTTFTIDEGYTELYVKVDASDPDGDAISLLLKIDGKDIRTENGAPYEWGHATSPNTEETLNLSSGDHTFEVQITDAKGLTTIISKTITVVRVNKAPTIEITSPKNNQVFVVGEMIEIKANASDDIEVSKVNFKVNGGYYKQDATPTGMEYSTVFTPTDAGFYTIGTRAFDNENGATEVSIMIEVLDELITSTVSNPNNELLVYPNPTDGIIHLNVSQTWEIHSSLGVKIIEGKGDLIDLSTYEKGVYILKTDNKILSIYYQ